MKKTDYRFWCIKNGKLYALVIRVYAYEILDGRLPYFTWRNDALEIPEDFFMYRWTLQEVIDAYEEDKAKRWE